MERRTDDEVPGLVKLATQAHDALICAQDELRREVAQAHDDVRPHAADLLAQKRRARHDLLGPRVAVSGRTALDHVGDVDLVAREARVAKKRIELVTGGADERLSPQIFVPSGPLAHEHHAGAGIAHAEHQVRARGAERAQLAVAHDGADLVERDLARFLVLMTGNPHDAHGAPP